MHRQVEFDMKQRRLEEVNDIIVGASHTHASAIVDPRPCRKAFFSCRNNKKAYAYVCIRLKSIANRLIMSIGKNPIMYIMSNRID